jgi:hypothetical protein
MTLTLASTNRVQLSYIAETNFGVTPTTGNQKNLRTTGETFDFNLTKTNDSEINANADLTSSTTVNAAAAGDLKVHFQYGEYDPFLASVMRSSWNVFGTNGVGTTFTSDHAAATITASVAPTGTSAFTTLAKGQWFRLSAPTTPNDGKLVRVSTVTAPTSTVITLDSNTPLSASLAVANCAISTSRVSNSVNLQSFSIERQAGDVGQFFQFKGMYPSKFSTSFASAQLTQATFSFIGKNVSRATATAMPGSPVSSLAYDIQNAVTGVGNLWEAGVPLTTTYIKTMTLDVDSGLRAQDAIGNLGMIGAGIGTFIAKGTLEIYFADGTLYDKFINNVYTSIIVSSTDSAGNGYVFTFPKVNLTTGKIQAGAKDQDLLATFEYTAYRDLANPVAALQKSLFIDRVGAAVLP